MDVIPTIRAVPPSHYLAYLNSPGWRTRRNRALENAGWQCSKCPSRRGLEVHHLTYERLGLERDADLEVLCIACHRGEHLENPDQTSLGVYLRLASEAVQNEPFALIADLAEAMRIACARRKIPARPERINSALAVVCGNRLRTPKPPTIKEIVNPQPQVISKAEAFEILCRLTGGMGTFPIKQIPAAKRSEIDIYGTIPNPDWGDHDRY